MQMQTRPLSPILASLANVFRIPVSSSPSTRTRTAPMSTVSVTRAGAARPGVVSSSSLLSKGVMSANANANANMSANMNTSRPFSSTPALGKKKKGMVGKGDRRIKLIRYFLSHPITPRPLRLSRTRYLRHWTIHRAFQLHRLAQREARQLELQRQYQAMAAACEELRTGAGDGGKLFRLSMNKRGVFGDLFPIEYARLQTEGPAREGWNYGWRRDGGRKW